MAVAMLPGTFCARRHAAHATPGLLLALTASQAVAVVALGIVRPTAAVTLAVLAIMAFVNGWRSMVASALGMDTAPEDKVAVMALRGAANQFGYLLGAAAGGLALAFGSYPELGLVLAALFLTAMLTHLPAHVRASAPAVQQATA
jgi:predicted MFS family arabinose efflux permease